MNLKVIIATTLLLASTIAAQTKFRTPQQIPDQIMTAELQAVDDSALLRLSNEKRVIVLVMWAAWCIPCRLQVPELNKISSKYHGRGLSVVGLVRNSEETLQYIRQTGVSFSSFWITKEMSESLNPNNILPITFVIRNDGTVVRTFVGWDDKTTPRLLAKVVKEALKRAEFKKDGKT